MNPRRPRRVLIVGAGIGGLATATALGQRGWIVEVVEIKPDADVPGVGIGLGANGMRALRRIGVADKLLSVGYAQGSWKYYDRHGTLVYAEPMGSEPDGTPQATGLPRAELARVLGDAARSAGATVVHGTTITAIEQRHDKIEAATSTGGTGEYDLLVAADGIYSPTREWIHGPQALARFTGFAAWRVPLAAHPDVRESRLYQGFARKAGLALIGDNRMYLHLVLPQPARPCRDPSVAHTVVRQQLSEGGFTGLIAEIAAEISEPDGIAYTPFEEVLLTPPWHVGNAVVIGDAAHSSMPHLGQGASMALEDAVVLAELLDDDGAVADLSIASRSAGRRASNSSIGSRTRC